MCEAHSIGKMGSIRKNLLFNFWKRWPKLIKNLNELWNKLVFEKMHITIAKQAVNCSAMMPKIWILLPVSISIETLETKFLSYHIRFFVVACQKNINYEFVQISYQAKNQVLSQFVSIFLEFLFKCRILTYQFLH